MEEERQLTQLHKAIDDHKPWIAIAILKVHPELITRGSTSGDGETLLMMAIKKGCSSKYIDKLIEMTPDEGLRTQDNGGNTILHSVAMVGNTELAKLLIMKCPTLLLIHNNSRDLPIHVAVKQRHCLMTDYLLSVVKQLGYDDPFAGVTRKDIMLSAIAAGMDDVIIALSYNNPDLVKSINEEEEPTDEPSINEEEEPADEPVHCFIMAEIETQSDTSEMEAEEQLIGQLGHAIHDNKPLITIAILKVHPELCTRQFRPFGWTILMMAILSGGCSTEYIAKIIEMTPDEGLSKQNKDGDTVLHMVTSRGKIELAKLLLEKCPNLLLIRQSGSGDLPIHTAVRNGHRDMKDYFLKVSKEQKHDDPFVGVKNEYLLPRAIETGMNDVIIALGYNNPDLVFKLIEEERRCNEQTVESRLLKAINDDDQSSVNSILNEHQELMTARVGTPGETPIMVAAAAAAKKVGSSDKFGLIKMLIGRMSDEELSVPDYLRNTVLHTAAMVGNTQVAKMLLQKCPTLLGIRNLHGETPICLSVKRGHKDMTKYLFDRAREEGHDDPFTGAASMDVLCSALKAGWYDVAYFLLMLNNVNPRLEIRDNSALNILAEDPSASRFRSGERGPTYFHAAIGPFMHCILGVNFEHYTIPYKIIEEICARSRGHEKASSIFKEPFLLAARNGVEAIVSLILQNHPDAINFVDEDNHSICQLAVMYRQENIFTLAYQSNVEVSTKLLPMLDNEGNNILHLAGYQAHQNRLVQSTSRVILQMQRELKWFKRLENLLSLQDIKLKNDVGKTPLEIFNEEHKDMVAKETQWMTSMAQACSVAAPLIATVAFAAAITVPGGNNNSNGLPMFSNHKTFKIFVVSDAIALFASIACLLSFLSVFTSRYGVDDFLYALPNRLIIGLVCLFISAISLMIAFGTTLFLVFGQENSLSIIPIIIFSCAPLILYAILQVPSLLNMMKSTYDRSLMRALGFRLGVLKSSKELIVTKKYL